ncbi:MAG TPA: hypothetical protein VK464_27810 [Symbiobacteriaceae bacterium]|nr:hypothetical protein [Symbiobacteriaceae bacterium]
MIATTHNPALLNALEKDDLQGVVVCYRDAEQGDSRFVPWLKVDAYPALMVRAKLGDLVSTGKVQEAVRGKELPGQQGQDWIKENRP